MGTTGTNAGYSVTVEFTNAWWSGRTLNYTAHLKVNSGNTYYIGLSSSGYLAGTGAGTAYYSGNSSLNGTNTSTEMLTISGSVGADGAGNAGVSISGDFGTQYPFWYNGYQIGLSKVSASDYGNWHINTPPNEPGWAEVTRNSATNFYIRYYQNGGGPAVTYYVQRARNAAMNDTLEETGANPNPSGFNWSADANVTYYYRIRAVNSDGTTYSSTVGPYYGQPTAPQNLSVSPITTANDRIQVSFSAPWYTGNVQSYTLTRYKDGVLDSTINNIYSSPYYDVEAAKVPGAAYTYSLKAIGSAFVGPNASTGSVVSPGVPYAPTSEPQVSNLGLNMTVTSAAVSGNGGVSIDTSNANQGYFIQYQVSDALNDPLKPYGYNNVAGAWSPAIKMSDQINRSHTFELMTPAKFYKFRIYAANTVTKASNDSTYIAYPHINETYISGVNFATTAAGFFLAAGGKIWTGTEWIPTKTAKRFDGTTWVPLVTAKRFNGTSWVPLT